MVIHHQEWAHYILPWILSLLSRNLTIAAIAGRRFQLMWCSMLLPKDFDKKRTFSITSVSIGWSINAKFCIQFILTPGRSSSECGPSQTKRFAPSPSSLFLKILDQTSLLSKSSTRPAKRESQTSFILYLLSNIFSQYEQHIDLQREKLRLLKTEFEGIKDDLDKHGDKYVDKYLDKGAWPRKILNC